MPAEEPYHYHSRAVEVSDFCETLGLCQGEELIKQVREGVAFAVFTQLATASGFRTSELAKMVGLSRYALHQGRQLRRLSRQQSDRLIRVARVIGATRDLFDGDQVLANRWLLAPQRGLGGWRPAEMLATEVEADSVLNLIGRIEHGTVS